MEVRFKLDSGIDATLIKAIKSRANGGSISKSVYLILNDWLSLQQYMEKMGNNEGLNGGDTGTTAQNGNDLLNSAIADLEEIWE